MVIDGDKSPVVGMLTDMKVTFDESNLFLDFIFVDDSLFDIILGEATICRATCGSRGVSPHYSRKRHSAPFPRLTAVSGGYPAVAAC